MKIQTRSGLHFVFHRVFNIIEQSDDMKMILIDFTRGIRDHVFCSSFPSVTIPMCQSIC